MTLETFFDVKINDFEKYEKLSKKELISFLKKCDDFYYNSESTLVSDDEYDFIKNLAKTKYSKDPYFKQVGSSPKKDKVKHEFILGSLKKTKSDETSGDFVDLWLEKHKNSTIIITPKFDGLSIYSHYKKGNIELSATRGDGEEGQNITQKAKLFCPNNLSGKFNFGDKEDYYLKVRGEVILPGELYKDLGFKNARNGASGIIGRDDFEYCDKLKVVFYELIETNIPYEKEKGDKESVRLSLLKEYLGKENCVEFICSPASKLNSKLLIEILNNWKKRLKDICNIDGLVLTIDDSTRENEKYPTQKVAFKVNEDPVDAVVGKIVWETTRTGKVVPVVNLEVPVDISGALVSRASAYNPKYIIDNKIGTGTQIKILRSGEVIPYIVKIVSGEKESPEVPMNCPSCGNSLIWSDTGVDLICENSSCPSQILYRIEYFLRTLGVEDLSATTLEKFDLKSVEEVYTKINKEYLLSLDGFKDRKAEIIMSQIDNSLINVNVSKLLAAFGINGLGEKTAEKIVDYFKTLDAELTPKKAMNIFFSIDVDEFLNVDGIGAKSAKKIDEERRKIQKTYNFLLENGLSFAEIKKGQFEGIEIVMTGSSPDGRKRPYLEKILSDNGAKIGGGISKKTKILIAEDINGNSGKLKKAREYGTQIMSYMDFFEKYNI